MRSDRKPELPGDGHNLAADRRLAIALEEAVPDIRCRIVQVDRDPIAVAHSRSSLEANDRAVAIQLDFRDVEAIFAGGVTRRLLEFSLPTGLLMADLLHYVPDSWEPGGILAEHSERLASGGYLVISHLTADRCPQQALAEAEVMSRSRDPMYPRSHAEFIRFFAGFDLIGPGVVDVARWHPEKAIGSDEQLATARYAGVGRKP